MPPCGPSFGLLRQMLSLGASLTDMMYMLEASPSGRKLSWAMALLDLSGRALWPREKAVCGMCAVSIGGGSLATAISM